MKENNVWFNTAATGGASNFYFLISNILIHNKK